MRIGSVLLCISLLITVSVTSVFADEVTATLVSKVLESFDGDLSEDPKDDYRTTDWIVRGSKFATIEKASDGSEIRYPLMAYATTYPNDLFGPNPADKENLKVIGIHGKFDRKGHNFIEIIPATTLSDEEWDYNPLQIPGRVKYLDLWVWGANYDFTLEVHIRDWQGIPYVLQIGSLAFKGWKNLFIEIPHAIPQADIKVPSYKQLEITKFVIWTNPNERVADFYVYLDHIKVLTDLHETQFDGIDLTYPDKIQEIWQNSGGN